MREPLKAKGEGRSEAPGRVDLGPGSKVAEESLGTAEFLALSPPDSSAVIATGLGTEPKVVAPSILNLRNFNVGDAASTLLYAAATGAVIHITALHGKVQTTIAGVLFVIVIVLDWISRIFLFTNFPEEDQSRRGDRKALLAKFLLECVCVTLMTSVAVSIIEGEKLDSESLKLLTSCMFFSFLLWNWLVVGILKDLNASGLVSLVIRGDGEGRDSFGVYLTRLKTLHDRAGERLTDVHDSVPATMKDGIVYLSHVVARFLVLIFLLFIAAHVVIIPLIYCLVSLGEYNNVLGASRGLVVEYGRSILVLGLIAVVVTGVLAFATSEEARRPGVAQVGINGWSIGCFLLIVIGALMLALWLTFEGLMVTWFIEVSAVSVLLFVMSQNSDGT